MTLVHPPSSLIITIIFTAFISSLTPHDRVVHGLGLASTTAITYGTSTVCGIVADNPTQSIQCYQNIQTISVQPIVSFEAISGGKTFFCGLRSGGFSLLCWDTSLSSSSRFQPKRIYHSDTIALSDLAVGDAQVCARQVNSRIVRCWRGGDGTRGSLFPSPGEALDFHTITSGRGFTCGILMNGSRVLCWGQSSVGAEIQTGFENVLMSSLVVGESHACGLSVNGALVCKGNNDSGQLNVPSSTSAFEFSGLALGSNFTCAIRRRNGFVVCWGGRNRFEYDSDAIENVSFELIAAGLDFLCGLTTSNLSMICWGPGWTSSQNDLPLGMIVPGPCVQGPCSSCGVYPNSETLCGGSGKICKSCQIELPIAVPLPPINPPSTQASAPASSSSITRNRPLLAFAIVGSVGAFTGLCTIIFCLWTRKCGSWSNHHDSVQPTSAVAPNAGSAVGIENDPNAPPSRSSSIKGYLSGSSSKHGDKTESFHLAELSAATKHFSSENKIGAGSFGTVYKGKLSDGREVAIKRGDTSTKTKKFQEKETAFDSELALLSRLHHKHLVKLVGSCEEKDERLLVYEYMCNGSLHDHLHNKKNVERSSSIVNSWRMRIKIALDAARGIEYLHNYAVPTIIHRDIKSSNILLDENWTARVSDFGLSLLGPECDQEIMSSKAVGTVGYIDPEYFVSNVLTAKSDVYGFGVVLLELLTGKRAVFRFSEEGTGPMGVVEYAGPRMMAGELQSILDQRVVPPDPNEAEAVELLAYTARHCVNLEGKERPSMTDIVANLERALALCEDERFSFSTTTISLPSL
ncbi:unnamed protein product [Prunus armeniaca]|uniref:non-specific serine/threonine protein kinase n=1 Tax=Prunus armeniaca TaxID=36596 RepID=A0A6J5XL44_PRUAR|nr:hypothetical protein GBA52_021392 [Prunus armeniaca]CAB4312675.1 unnamed protein product [Prunus armeniaca]